MACVLFRKTVFLSAFAAFLFLCPQGRAQEQAQQGNWDEAVVRNGVLELAVGQCLQEVIVPQNYTSHEGEEEMQACLARKGVVTVPENREPAGRVLLGNSRASGSSQGTPLPYEIPDMDLLVRNLEAGKAGGATPPPVVSVQEKAPETEPSSQGSLYVRSSKGSAGEKKAKPVFLDR